jgi:hypothetical protein
MVAMLALGGSVASAEEGNPKEEIHFARLFSQIVQPTSMPRRDVIGPGQSGRQQTYCGEAGEAGRGVFDKDISCDNPFAPDNELAVAVHPTNPNLVLAGSNDYQISFVGNAFILQVPSGFFLSQDGGKTWLDGELPMKGSLGGGDPAPYFDKKHNQMVFASLSFVCGQFAPVCSRGNVMFASSPLDKLTGSPNDKVVWSDQTVANGSGSDNAAQQIFLDKEWITVDNYPSSPNYGNIYIVYQQYRTESGRYDESPTMFVKSEDGGKRWTLPAEISGRNPAYCTFQDDPNDPDVSNSSSPSDQANSEGPDDPFACDQDSFSYPTVAPDGTLYVQFDNEQNSQAYEPPQRYDSQVMIVKSTDGGDTFFGETPTAANQNDNPATPTNEACVRIPQAAKGKPVAGFQNPCIVPIHVVNKEDSYDFTNHGADGTAVPDYPINPDGRTTLTGHTFRVNSAGTIAVGPNGGVGVGYRLWTVFADNLHGIRPGNGLPADQPPAPAPAVAPVTNTDVFYAYSDDGGNTWTGGDQGFPNSNPLTRLQANPVDLADDQWFPWADTNKTNGALVVGYMDGGAFTPGARETYGFSNVTIAGGVPGPRLVVSSAPSEPDRDLLFGDECPDNETDTCSAFIGDYNGLAVDSNGNAHSVWTDLRRGFPGPGDLKAQDAFYAKQPLAP